MFHIALHEPRIAPNTGNIIRLAANNGCQLHLIEPLGFSLEDKQLRRAGLDYHDLTHVSRYQHYAQFLQAMPDHRILACTTKGHRSYHQIHYEQNDILLFGSETSGLPEEILHRIRPEYRIRIPMQPTNRSLNLSNAVAIISYEGWRQLDFRGGQ
ncbi:MAG TPA: tRNA (cytidine(34)-2'-O)-methyltransferase [Gammaproteobacteria bacterium]|nr:tRNA (cytidine(34)-2'-O)-methyltransferase [Gammaproteobacteria bacterium]